jgi:hypothetical protein
MEIAGHPACASETAQLLKIVAAEAPYAASRLQQWRADHAAYARVHGEGAYAAQERFYAVISRLYEGGSLGGVRLTARMP